MVVQKKDRAIYLRKRGYTFQEIIRKVKIAKSTLSKWVNTELSNEEETAIKKLTSAKGLQKIIKINKLRSLRIINKERLDQFKYAKQIRRIKKKELFWIGLGLYMAEGAKTGRWKSAFYNSDPLLNKIMIKFYKEICRASEKRIHIQLILHEHISENKAKKYWNKTLAIPLKNFNKASFVKSKASKGIRPKNSLPFGTVQIAVGDKKVTNKIKGWILGINNSF